LNIEKKRMHSLRVAYENWYYPNRFKDLMDLLKKYPCNLQSVALFTSATHPPLTLEETEIRLNIIKERLDDIRSLGLFAGINILGTIGHHEEDLDNHLKGDYTYMTNKTGDVCRGSYCMNDEKFINEYVIPVYTKLAEAHPDFIWIDDDVRLPHMPVGHGCFCQNCIDKFNRKNNTSYTREELVETISSINLDVRRLWLDHNKESIVNLFKTISSTVYAIDENITLGFMTGERYFESYDFKAFAEALSDNGRHNIMWRPGGGAYTDYKFTEIVEKVSQCGRQNAYLPDYVTIIQTEIENFPYNLIKKTPTSTALECAWNMTGGCTGAALNILPSETNEPMETIIPHLKAINNFSAFFELLSEKTGGKQPYGIGTAWRPDCQLATPENKFIGHFGSMYSDFTSEFFDLGLPQSYASKNACVTLVKGHACLHWTDNEIKELLSSGIYMDSAALDFFNERNFGDMLGFKTDKNIPIDAREAYTDHNLNEDIIGGIRNCRQAFNQGDSFSLTATSEKSQKLAKLIDYHDNTLADCCQGLFENTDGGKIAIGGYYPFTWISDYYKSHQLKRLMVKLSNGRLPSYVESYCRIRNHTFVDENETVVALFNHTNEDLENISVAVKTDKEIATCHTTDNKTYTLRSIKEDNGYKFFNINQIPAIRIILITA